ncbi:MAG: dihydrofolate reductase [Verrucomicrobiales bacterium]|jgi:dihydrofolate reductase|nr:dihydrofolate reductase [Verrucomicrobiales bacterium]MBT6450694.1 dihydrofolate reductase [Verrucomicrobiales bacterium]
MKPSAPKSPNPQPVFKAIAAMSLNRVIGNGLKIPWHLPEDFKWFKQTTMGEVLVMGRRTFESIGRALPGRETFVLTRGDFSHPDVTVIRSLDDIAPRLNGRTGFIAGGAQIYEQALPRCSDLLLTIVQREVEGDVSFPPFENHFEEVAVLRSEKELCIVHYRNREMK